MQAGRVDGASLLEYGQGRVAVGAAALTMPGEQAPAPRETESHMGLAMQQAVDIYDAAARLESQGYGDSTARTSGYRDVFEMAGGLMIGTRSRRERRSPTGIPVMLMAALGRMLVLLGGVIISLTVLPQNAAPYAVFVTGAVGWICGQGASAGIWRGMSTSRPLAAASALGSAPIFLGLAAVVSLAIGSWAPLLWALWSMSASVMVIIRPGMRMVFLAVLGAAVSFGASLHSHGLGVACAVVVIVVAGCLAVRLIRQEDGTFGIHDRSVTAAQLMGASQAAGQLVLLGMVLIMLGPEFFVSVAIAGLVAGALSDPILELVQAVVRHVATFAFALRTGRLLTAMLGFLGASAVIAAAIITAIVVRDMFSPGEGLTQIVLATSLVAGVAAATGLLLRAGTALGAMLLALGGAVLGVAGAITLHLGPYPDTVILFLLSTASVVVAGWLAVRHMSHPAAW